MLVFVWTAYCPNPGLSTLTGPCWVSLMGDHCVKQLLIGLPPNPTLILLSRSPLFLLVSIKQTTEVLWAVNQNLTFQVLAIYLEMNSKHWLKQDMQRGEV